MSGVPNVPSGISNNQTAAPIKITLPMYLLIKFYISRGSSEASVRILTSDARLSVIQSFIINAFRRVHLVLLKVMKVIFLSMI